MINCNQKEKQRTATNCIKPIGYGVPLEGEKYRMPCKMWNCPVCSKVLVNRLLDDVKYYLQFEDVRFLTLTESANAPNKDDIMLHFRRLMAVLRKEYKGIKGFWTKEFTKRGVRHLHVLINQYIPQKRIKELWIKATEGYSSIVHIQKARINNVAGYMMKYLTKQLRFPKFKRHERRYGFIGGYRPHYSDFYDKQSDVTVELEQHFNPDSKYWLQYYNENQVRWGSAYVDYMNYIMSGWLSRWKIDGYKGWHYKSELNGGRNRWRGKSKDTKQSKLVAGGIFDRV